MAKNKSFLLENEINYLLTFQFNEITIISKFMIVIQYYILYSIENASNIDESIFNSGIFMTVNVFRLLLYYTKNLELTLYHTQNAIYYYVEYISQITDSEHNLFFNLSIKDAITYVYSRTIYIINKKYLKLYNEKDNNILKKFTEKCNIYIGIINNISIYILNETNDICKDLLQELSTVYLDLYNKKINYDNIISNICKTDNLNLNKIIEIFKDESKKLV